MVRLMGAVLVAAGCAWVGFQVSEGMRRRVAELRELARGLALVERELELWAPPLPQLMERAAEALVREVLELRDGLAVSERG